MVSNPLAAFGSLITGVQQQPAQTQGSAEGVVSRVKGSVAEVKFKDFSADHFLTARFGRTSNPPQIGDACLVVFADNRIDKAWLISWNSP